MTVFKTGQINQEIYNFWKHEIKKSPKNTGKYHPLYYPDLTKKCILFIGSNPSFSDKGFNEICALPEWEENYLSEIIKIGNYENYFLFANRAFKREVLGGRVCQDHS